MAETTRIEWCDRTWSPWVGCQKISPGCDHCYAEGWSKRAGRSVWGPHAARQRTSANYWRDLIKWDREASAKGVRISVFPSLCDPFDNKAPAGAREDFWHYVNRCRNLDFLLLTKRPENIVRMLPDPRTGVPEWGNGWPNVWVGASAENQEEYDRRKEHLRAVKAAVLFWSFEPLLGPIEANWLGDWIIIGGESGNGARPMQTEWALELLAQAAFAATPVFMKQMGGTRDKRDRLEDLPPDLRVREWPDVGVY